MAVRWAGVVYIYLNVRADEQYSQFRRASELREFLRTDSRLIEHTAAEFRNSSATPWLTLSMINASPEGNFAITGEDPGSFNLIELIGSAGPNDQLYRDIANGLAAFLGWELVDVTP